LETYLIKSGARHGTSWTVTPGQRLTVEPEVVAAFPVTARQAVGTAALTARVTATCEVAERIDKELVLYAYRVDAATPTLTDATRDVATNAQPEDPGPATVAASAYLGDGGIVEAPLAVGSAGDGPAVAQRPARTGARGEILSAVAAVMARTRRDTFTAAQVAAEMRTRGTTYADATILTMLTSHMSGGSGSSGPADLERAGRGVYRVRG